ncbi:RNA polymerase sigma factor [Streptomyces leeuwenhoekii]|uniref:RNA polymerase sigma factor n=1 Tax=Streptomyces leeuwenhoekii TaxID=1437453 RepID=UPI000B066685|nr:sigma factor [Streptomyces leeuwenhoekii]
MDTHLRTRIRAGDHDASGDLFDAYARSVCNHAFRLTGDWAAAEDVVSLTFLDAWRLRERLDADGGSLRPWLLGIATNVTRNTRRAARRHAAAVARLPRDTTVRDHAEEVAGRVDDAGRLALVENAADAAGRTGVAITREDPDHPTRDEWISDEETHEFLGERSVAREDHADVEEGTVTGNTAVLRRAVVDKPGQRP